MELSGFVNNPSLDLEVFEMATGTVKPKRTDGQMTGLAGELFVAAELLKRGFQTSITLGNAKAVDLLAIHPTSGRRITVQVKAVRRKNAWPISHKAVFAEHVYVFVILNAPGQPVEYFVVPGEKLANEPELFSKWFIDPKFPGIEPKTLKNQGFSDAWEYFDQR